MSSTLHLSCHETDKREALGSGSGLLDISLLTSLSKSPSPSSHPRCDIWQLSDLCNSTRLSRGEYIKMETSESKDRYLVGSDYAYVECRRCRSILFEGKLSTQYTCDDNRRSKK